MEKVREQLYKLKGSDGGWVLLHGLPGFGKTTLAAESLRCEALLQDVFPGGVFWLSVKDMSSGGEVDKRKLLEKLQKFILRVDKNKVQPKSIEAATKHLETVMRRQHLRFLLILDDIWEKEVAQVFSGCSRVLATSRNAEVATGLNTPFLINVTGFSDEEATALLSKMTKTPQDSLPEEAKDIIQYCMGSPLALGIIATRLSTSPALWRRIAQQLKSRSRAHNLLADVDRSIGRSIEDFSKNSKEKFHSLVVFVNSAVISTRVLGTFWSMDAIDCAVVMEG